MGAWRDVWGQIWQVRSMRQRTDVLQLQPVPGLLVPVSDVHLLGRQRMHLVIRMRGRTSSNTDYLAIMVTMTTTNLLIMTTVTLAIMTTAIMVTMTIVDCVTFLQIVTQINQRWTQEVARTERFGILAGEPFAALQPFLQIV